MAKYLKQLQVCIQPSNAKICSKSICFNIILHPINYSKLKERGCWEAVVMLGNRCSLMRRWSQRSTSRERMEKGISVKGAAGRACLHHPPSAAFVVFCDHTVSCPQCPARQEARRCLQLPPGRVHRGPGCSSELPSNGREATDTGCLTSK